MHTVCNARMSSRPGATSRVAIAMPPAVTAGAVILVIECFLTRNVRPGASQMALRVSTQDAKARLSEYVNRACYRGERFIIERHGKPMAAIVSPEDLTALESQPSPSPETYRRLLAERGLIITKPTGKPIRPEDRKLIKLEGKPLSQQIIEDRG